MGPKTLRVTPANSRDGMAMDAWNEPVHVGDPQDGWEDGKSTQARRSDWSLIPLFGLMVIDAAVALYDLWRLATGLTGLNG